jgi:hypothetical protein
MHLQREDLVVKPGTSPVKVDAGTPIGKVGMSGNTTGPHLHFTLIRRHDSHVRVLPDEYVDPFGWEDHLLSDPWPKYEWKDVSGIHTGSPSSYIWEEALNSKTTYFTEQYNQPLTVGRLNVLPTQDLTDPITIRALPAGQPAGNEDKLQFKYIDGTSFVLKAWDRLGNGIKEFSSPILVRYDLAELILENSVKATLKIYVYDQLGHAWTPLPTSVDYLSNTIEAYTDHFSHFSVMADSSDSVIPETSINILGFSADHNVYIDSAELTFSTQSPKHTTYVSFNEGLDWDTYRDPILLNDPANYSVFYRSISANGETEQTKRVAFSVVKPQTGVRITNVTLNISANYASP